MELSRGELLAWVNDLTGLSLPKVELMGAGGAHCVIVDSVFRDVPLHKVKFGALHEYEYVHNFKILQEAFMRHRVDRVVPVDRLVKLKFQDNLEFLQWMKRFWDANWDGSEYQAPDLSSNLKRQPVSGAAAVAKRPSQSATPQVNPTRRLGSLASMATSSGSASSIGSAASATSTANNGGSGNNANLVQLAALTKTITELKLSVDEMERERDFYFNKLRDIEILTQKVTDPVIKDSLFFRQITEILYTTEDGFEIPNSADAQATNMAA